MKGFADSLAFALAESVDSAFVRMAFRSRRSSERSRRATSAERLDEARVLYPKADAEGLLFPKPAPAQLSERFVRELPGGEAVDISWPSAYRPIDRRYEELLVQFPQTRLAQVRWMRHREVRPVVICLHGWGGGAFLFEERGYLPRTLYRLGADVVLFTLPFHGARAPIFQGRPIFPSPDPIATNEGFAQAISDLRALIQTLRARGAPKVAVAGLSLGGGTTGLLATVDPEVDALVPIIPFGSLPELVWEHGAGTLARRDAEASGMTFERFDAAFAATTAVKRRPVVPLDRVLIIAGERDQVVPIRHALRLRDHLSQFTAAPVQFASFPGAHLVQAGRAEAFRTLAQFLAERRVLKLPPAGQG